ncbi:type IV pilus assembly protein PilY1 [Neisseria sp. HSC-16F19]|nr:PilC/PilY family type IV pilus protein [Neisseria sp. HSC-16F19]MCP2039620.1 type IV pilus assembly protein PilY1 [Neisseria sp. HSC-16F19]
MKNIKKTTPRKIALATSAALAALLQANAAQAATPYAHVPLVWQSGTSAIKPNIMLFLDSSGSMAWSLPDANGTVNYSLPGGITNPNSRMFIAKDVIREILPASRERNNWGLATFNNPIPRTPLIGRDINNGGATVSLAQWQSAAGLIQMNVMDVSSDTAASQANYTNLVNRIAAVPALTNTPIASAYYEITRYYRGLTPGFGGLATPGNLGRYTSPIQYRCQPNYIIFISDGEPTGYANRYQLGALYYDDPHMTAANPNAATLRAQVWARRNNSWGVTEHIAGFVQNNDLVSGGTDAEGMSFDDPAFPTQNITTFTVGFGANVQVLNDMAQQGGGQYFLANNREELRQALLGSLQAIGNNSGFTPATPMVTSAGDGKITSAASTTLDPRSWTSELRFYPFDDATGTFNAAAYKTPKYKDGGTVTSVALFSTSSGVAAVAPNTYPAGFNNNLFGISNARTDLPNPNPGVFPITLSANNNEYRNLMAWLLRWNNADTDSGTNYRDRNAGNSTSLARFMGDVTGNVAVFGDVKVAAPTSGDFDRREFMAIPSNDGMLHVLKANEGADRNAVPYVEVLQYIPGTAARDDATDTVMRNLVFTAETTYGDLRNPRQSFLSGDLLHIKIDNEYSLVGAMGSGARGLYSLMVGGTNHAGNAVGLHRPQASWATSVPWWDTSTNQFGGAGSFYNQLGYNFGLPKVGYVSMSGGNWDNSTDVRAAAMFTSGMDDPNHAVPGLFVVDHMAKNYANSAGRASTGTQGQLIRKIPISRGFDATPTASATVAQIVQAHDGLTSAQAVDINFDGITDLVYAGDFKGNIWRFDLRGANPSAWSARMVYEGNGTQPLVAEPRLKVWGDGVVGIYFGTGSNLYQADLLANGPQSVYGVFDHVAACPGVAPATGLCTAAKRSDLIEQTLAPATSADGTFGYYINSTNTYSDLATRRGFYLDIPDSTYRVVTTPEVVSIGGRESAGVIWNLERLSVTGAGLASGAQMTCTPDRVEAAGLRLMADAYTGAVNPHMSWTNAKTSTTGQIMHTVPYAGSSSASYLYNGGDNSAYGASGMLGSGELGPAGQKPNPNEQAINCYREGVLVSSSSASGTQLDSFRCENPSGARRLSWREIF